MKTTYPGEVIQTPLQTHPDYEKVRYSLTLSIPNVPNKKTLFIIMMNPSKANIKRSDKTVDKLITYAQDNQFSKLVILNSLPYYESNSKKLKNLALTSNHLKKNLSVIADELSSFNNKSDQIIISTGTPTIRIGAESLAKIYELLSGKTVTSFYGIKSTGEKYEFNTQDYTYHVSTRGIISVDLNLSFTHVI